MAPVSSYVTRPLSPETWDDFVRLVEANNGVWGGCWCMGFHPEGVGKGHTVSGNRLAKQAHVRNGTVHQVLVYDGDECVGWCQYGSPVELPNINNPKAYAKDLGEMPDWRIGCIFTGSGHRRSGVARAALSAALAAIHDAGGGLIEAYPEQVEGRPPQRPKMVLAGERQPGQQVSPIREQNFATGWLNAGYMVTDIPELVTISSQRGRAANPPMHLRHYQLWPAANILTLPTWS